MEDSLEELQMEFPRRIPEEISRTVPGGICEGILGDFFKEFTAAIY